MSTPQQRLEAALQSYIHWAEDWKKLCLFGGDSYMFASVFGGDSCALCSLYKARGSGDCTTCPLKPEGDRYGCGEDSLWAKCRDAVHEDSVGMFQEAHRNMLTALHEAVLTATEEYMRILPHEDEDEDEGPGEEEEEASPSAPHPWTGREVWVSAYPIDPAKVEAGYQPVGGLRRIMASYHPGARAPYGMENGVCWLEDHVYPTNPQAETYRSWVGKDVAVSDLLPPCDAVAPTIRRLVDYDPQGEWYSFVCRTVRDSTARIRWRFASLDVAERWRAKEAAAAQREADEEAEQKRRKHEDTLAQALVGYICTVWDSDDGEPSDPGCKAQTVINQYDPCRELPFRSWRGIAWKHARLATPEEAGRYPGWTPEVGDLCKYAGPEGPWSVRAVKYHGLAPDGKHMVEYSPGVYYSRTRVRALTSAEELEQQQQGKVGE